MKLLGIDYGEKKTGLATSEGFLAEPVGIVLTSKVVSQILRICQENNIERIVIGVSEGNSAIKAKEFARNLGEISNLPIEFEDETLTTYEAVGKMRQAGKGIKDEDAISAALILQNYLDKQDNNLAI